MTSVLHRWRTLCKGIALCALIWGMPRVAVAGPYEIPARWIDDREILRPLGVDFIFHDIRPLGDLGVVAMGGNLVLRIVDGRPYVTLGWRGGVETAPTPTAAVGRLGGGTVAFAGIARSRPDNQSTFRGGRAFLMLSGSGSMRRVDGPNPPTADIQWASVELTPGSAGHLYALLTLAVMAPPAPRSIRRDAPTAFSRLYEFDGASWTAIPVTLALAPYTSLSSMCTTADGTLWIAGTVFEIDPHRLVSRTRGLALRREAEGWRSVSIPAPAERHVSWSLGRIACRTDGAWLAGLATNDPARARSWYPGDTPVIYRLEGNAWRQVHGLPPPLPTKDGGLPLRLGVDALAVDGSDRLWITFGHSHDHVTERIHAYDGDTWQSYDMPAVPGVAFYQVTGIAFDERGTGWAIANRYGNAQRPEGHGILLRFDGDQWRLQGWSWSVWRQRWLGLLGWLR